LFSEGICFELIEVLEKVLGFVGIFLTIARGSSNPSLLEGFGGRRIDPLPDEGV